jgi:hypothetical protein
MPDAVQLVVCLLLRICSRNDGFWGLETPNAADRPLIFALQEEHPTISPHATPLAWCLGGLGSLGEE